MVAGGSGSSSGGSNRHRESSQLGQDYCAPDPERMVRPREGPAMGSVRHSRTDAGATRRSDRTLGSTRHWARTERELPGEPIYGEDPQQRRLVACASRWRSSPWRWRMPPAGRARPTGPSHLSTRRPTRTGPMSRRPRRAARVGRQLHDRARPEANSSDASRALLVQRLAAHDRDFSLLNMDTIWTSEFAAAGWLQQDHRCPRQEVLTAFFRSRPSRPSTRAALYAVPAQHQRPAAVVPQGSRQDPADDLGAADRRRSEASGRATD